MRLDDLRPQVSGPGESLIVPGYRRDHEKVDPPGDFPAYRGTISRHPKRPLVPIPDLLTEVTGPLLTGAPDRVFDLMDAGLWYQVHGLLLDRFVLGDPVWESLAFRLWLMRVLFYTAAEASQGYDDAKAYLGSTIKDYEAAASR